MGFSCRQLIYAKKTQEYISGQEWSFKHSNQGELISLLILKVEILEEVEIVHITILGNDDLPVHMPFEKRAIEHSTISLLSEKNELPEYKEGYYYWKKLYTKGEAGIYDITVSEVLSL